jgi:hypothetical protein
MKLHSEISIGWIIVYAGKTSTESNVQERDDINISQKDSISITPIQYFRYNSEIIGASNKTIDINHSKNNQINGMYE